MAIVRTTSPGGELPDPKKTPTPKAPQRTPGRSMQQRAAQPADRGQFINDVRVELGRVVWPSRETVRSGVIVTIGLLIFFALYIFGLDVIAERLLGGLFSSD